jgi:hypothetical protein
VGDPPRLGRTVAADEAMDAVFDRYRAGDASG